MPNQLKYRVTSVAGVMAGTAVAVAMANHPVTGSFTREHGSGFDHSLPGGLVDADLLFAAALGVVVLCCLSPLYEPRSRRTIDTILLVQKRILVAGCVLATFVYFGGSPHLPQTTLLVTTGLLFLLLPGWFVAIGKRPISGKEGTIIVGDDPTRINRAARATETPILGYITPPIVAEEETNPERRITLADGGTIELLPPSLVPLGGLSRFNRTLANRNVTSVVLAFSRADRGEFFGVLEACHQHGIEAKVLREQGDSVLVSKGSTGELVTVDLEPWSWRGRLCKRGFDVAFAGTGLVLSAPFLALIAIAIKLDSPGPVFYNQRRTSTFGETFVVSKFRTMLPDSESTDPVDDDENDRITRVGRLLRKSNLDELPQLWAILVGEMSVVGPRAVWIDEEALLEREVSEWRKRWFVKPGLTGLAQINDVSSTDPERKLRYDLEYIRRQSFRLDVTIVMRQVWLAVTDVCTLVRGKDPDVDAGEATK